MTTYATSYNTRSVNRPDWFGNLAVFIYAAISIFYIFPSGNPQPSDMLIGFAVLIAFIAFLSRKTTNISSLSFCVIGFGLYTFVINIIHYSFFPDPVFFKSSLYYIFNGSVMLLIIGLFKRNAQITWKALYFGIVVSITLEFLYIQFLSGNSLQSRMVGTFNNPNQLALWSLLCACLLIALRSKDKLKIFDMGLLLALGYIQTLSLSKAGIICYALLLLSLVFSKMISGSAKAILFVSFVIAGFFILANLQGTEELFGKLEAVQRTMTRLASIGTESDESLEGRNYTRIVNYPEFLLLGAGEGGYARFGSTLLNLEMHSSLGTIFFSYGAVGMGLFLFLLYKVARHNNPHIAVLIFIILLYGLTHQSARFTDFWVFLGAAYGMRYIRVESDFTGLDPERRRKSGLSISQ